jgi:chemotaxis signal transduction protein
VVETRRPADTGDEVRLLFFRSAGERFAIEVGYLREIVIPHPAVTPVPFVPPTVAGVVNHRGVIFTLVRFARLVGFVEDSEGAVALLRLPDMAVGITVEAIEGIEPVPGRVLSAAGVSALGFPFLRLASDRAGRPVQVIDAELLIDAIYRLPVAMLAGETLQEAAHG